MKKVLFILLLVSNFCFGQINLNFTTQGPYDYSTSGLGAVNSQTYYKGKVYLFIYLRFAAATPGDFSVTGTNTTWTPIVNTTAITTATDLARLKVFVCSPSADYTEALSISGAGLATGTISVLLEIDGTPTNNNGSGAIVQVVTGSADAGADPTITMAALETTSRNTVLAFFGNNVNPFGATMETDWTELSQGGFNTPTSGGVFIKRDYTVDNTPSVVASASDWIGVAFEIRGGRRVTVIN